MILVAHAVLDGIVSADDGATVCKLARASLVEWLSAHDIRTGDHILIVRDLDGPVESETP